MSWRDRTQETLQAASRHARANPECARGGYTVATVKDNRTNPPTVTQDATCDTCNQPMN